MLNRREALRRLGAVAVAATGANWVLGEGGWVRSASAAAGSEPLSVDVLSRGSSSLMQVRRAKTAVPLAKLSAGDRQLVAGVLNNLSLYRKLPEIRCETDPRVLEFFLDHPDVAVSVWRAMGVSELMMSETNPNQYHADAGDGSVGDLKLMLKSPQERVIYCQGRFVNPVAKTPIQAKCVLHFRNRYEQSRSGRSFARHSATMFVSLPQNAVRAAARVISPVSNRIADKNFEEISLFIRMMSVAMESRPEWCEQVAGQLRGVTTEQSREFLRLATTVHEDRGVVQTAGRRR